MEVSVFRVMPLTAGAMKNAFRGCADRRSLFGMDAISPLILVSALARAEGFWVRKAPARSAHSSR